MKVLIRKARKCENPFAIHRWYLMIDVERLGEGEEREMGREEGGEGEGEGRKRQREGETEGGKEGVTWTDSGPLKCF